MRREKPLPGGAQSLPPPVCPSACPVAPAPRPAAPDSHLPRALLPTDSARSPLSQDDWAGTWATGSCRHPSPTGDGGMTVPSSVCPAGVLRGGVASRLR